MNLRRPSFIVLLLCCTVSGGIFFDVPWYNSYIGLTQLSYNPVGSSRLYFLSVNVRMEERQYDDDEQAELLMGSG
uniref:Uncharacterized protein n=1 Tax=Globodera rostochiensis TaxID=31243 RepID=A0A914HPM8_GLORO